MRVLWTAAELGLTYRHVSLEFDDPFLKTPEFLAINPAGTIPAIVDDDFALGESLAINLYLAKKYGAEGAWPLYPATRTAEAEMWRWSLWAQAQLEPWVQRDALLADLREAIGSHAERVIQVGLAVLEEQLRERTWLLGAHFTAADLCVAGILSPSRADRLDLQRYDRVRDWLSRCYERPAAKRTRRRFAS